MERSAMDDKSVTTRDNVDRQRRDFLRNSVYAA